jgi:hypothetical protein
MDRSIALELAAVLADSGFSLDELVVRTRLLFEREGMAGFVSLVLDLVDAWLCREIVHGDGRWQPKPCCETPCYEFKDRLERRLRTSVGTVRLRWRRLRCKCCGRSCVPLREFTGLEPYQPKTAELERIVTEVVAEQNYRRLSHHLRLIGEIPVPKSTAHRWVMASDCDEVTSDGKHSALLFADGTAYKRRPDPERGLNNRGEVRVVLGVTSNGTVLPLGAFSGQSWSEIGTAVGPAGTEPIADVLISDAESGLAESLAHLVRDRQRCHWHQVHDLDQFMWRDGAGRKERRKTQTQLAGIIGIELPAGDFEQVSEKDKAELGRAVVTAEEQLEGLVKTLEVRGYDGAAQYIRYAKERLFTYVRWWLKSGLVMPRASSMIERLMRELGRRLKRIAFGWSECGAAKMARIIIKRITSAGEWTAYWHARLRITGNVTLTLNRISAI